MILALWLLCVSLIPFHETQPSLRPMDETQGPTDNIIEDQRERPIGPMPCVFELTERVRWEV